MTMRPDHKATRQPDKRLSGNRVTHSATDNTVALLDSLRLGKHRRSEQSGFVQDSVQLDRAWSMLFGQNATRTEGTHARRPAMAMKFGSTDARGNSRQTSTSNVRYQSQTRQYVFIDAKLSVKSSGAILSRVRMGDPIYTALRPLRLCLCRNRTLAPFDPP